MQGQLTYSPWHLDRGATHHLTPYIVNLCMAEECHGGDQVQVGNGQGLQILHSGNTIYSNLNKNLF